jgi:hypothetical protein
MADDAQPLDHAEVSGLRIAGGLRHRVGNVPKQRVLAEISGIKTKGQARAYMRGVDAMINARTAGTRVGPGRGSNKAKPGAKPRAGPVKRAKAGGRARAK